MGTQEIKEQLQKMNKKELLMIENELRRLKIINSMKFVRD